MSQGWDELPELNLATDPEARDPRYARSVRSGKMLIRSLHSRAAKLAQRRAQMQRRSAADPDAGLRKFGGDA